MCARRIAHTPALLALILGVAGAVRVHHLDAKSFWYDEFASIELACGRGYSRYDLPVGQFLTDPPDLTSLASAAPLRSVWFSETRWHVPPLYEFVLRLWGVAFGLSQFSARLFSSLTSVASVLMLFLAVRELSGVTTALWSAAIMALAGPQIQFAQEARPYALLVFGALAAAAVLLRIERRGFTTTRGVVLALSVLASALTHYFALGAMLALAIYASVALDRSNRLKCLGCFAAAALLWIPLGAPIALQQLRGVKDPIATAFVQDDAPGHLKREIVRAAVLPVRFIAEPMRPSAEIAIIGAAAYMLALLLPIGRRDLLIWGLWLCLTLTPVILLDLSRHTRLLDYMRYTLLASPALYVLLAGAMSTHASRWLHSLPPTVVTLAAILSLPTAYEAWWKADWRSLASAVRQHARAGDVFVFASDSDHPHFMPTAYVHVNFYSPGRVRPIVFLSETPSEAVERELRSATGVLVVARDFDDVHRLFAKASPGMTRLAYEPTAASLWRITWPAVRH